MKAVYFKEFGGPEVLTYGDLPEPVIGPSEALIRVRATALNHLDVWRRAGQRGTRGDLKEPFILGCDVAGEVAQIGTGVAGLKPGDRVILNPGVTCGLCEWCQTGRDNMCPRYVMIGATVNGGYAQYAKAPAQNVHVITAGLSWEEMAATPLTMLTAWHMLMGLARLRSGETVLIQAAGSGVGTSALQIAKLVGARAIVTASTDEKLAKAKKMGADETINYARDDFAAKVKELTGGRGVDVVFDHVGESVFEKNLASLARGGRFVNCGITSGYKANLHIGQLFTRQLQIFGSYMGNRGDMAEVVRLVNQGKLRGVVDKTYPLEQAAQAQKDMEDRNVFGKLVLKAP